MESGEGASTAQRSNRGAISLMVQGTSSDAGKSTLVTALCRALVRRGFDVAPFKPQNMALNAAVTADGGEIGRAQAVQAQACRLAPHTDMNPVLLKPASDRAAQVILQGRAIGTLDALAYQDYKRRAREAVLDSWQRLGAAHAIRIVEGAGSPAEINLRENDIANMGFAEAVDCPVILVADIDRGGVFAQLVGTLELLSPSERARVKGFVINRFRGDIRLLESGLDWLEARTGKPVLGVLPYLHGLHIDAEDALPERGRPPDGARFNIVVPVLPRISNHTDLDPLRLHPDVALHLIGPGESLPPCDLILLPGSKNVRADLAALREQGWDRDLQRHLRYGGKLIGLCGGYQMLCQTLADPLGIEGPPGESAGLGLLPGHTRLQPDKTLRPVRGRLAFADAPVEGYEIHAGLTEQPADNRPAVWLDHGPDGALSADGQIMGSYVHGLFDTPEACAALLAWAGLDARTAPDIRAIRERDIDRLADTVEHHLDMNALMAILHGAHPAPRAPRTAQTLPPRPPGPRRLILGGARSGKSAYAERQAAQSGQPVTVIATAQALDTEMAERIARHQAARPAHWALIEAPLALADALRAAAAPGRTLIVDCLTLWLTNLILCEDDTRLEHERRALLDTLPQLPGQLLLVANEVGLGIVPDNPLARRFRDEAGRLNQALAERCDDVLLITAGLPQRLKPGG